VLTNIIKSFTNPFH